MTGINCATILCMSICPTYLLRLKTSGALYSNTISMWVKHYSTNMWLHLTNERGTMPPGEWTPWTRYCTTRYVAPCCRTKAKCSNYTIYAQHCKLDLHRLVPYLLHSLSKFGGSNASHFRVKSLKYEITATCWQNKNFKSNLTFFVDITFAGQHEQNGVCKQHYQ